MVVVTKIIPMKISNVIAILEQIAPPSLQESYDNCGLLTGDSTHEVTNILTTLDATEGVVQEAIDKNCNLIVAHHPIIFGGLKNLTPTNYVKKTVLKAIKNDIAIYAIHTNLDNVLMNGVNQQLATVLGLINQKILKPKKGVLAKTEFLCSKNPIDIIAQFNQLRATSNVFEGKNGFLVKVEYPYFAEKELMHILSTNDDVQWAEKPQTMPQSDIKIGSGVVGELIEALEVKQFLDIVKESLVVPTIKHTKLVKSQVQKIAVCGGSGGFLLQDAIKAGADVFLTADYKYHEFFDAEDKIIIVDTGHYESEQYTKDLLAGLLNSHGFSAYVSTVRTNPVYYY